MMLAETFRTTGPPPPGLAPLSGGTITVPEPTRPAQPPVKPPFTAPAREVDAPPEIKHSTYKPSVPKTIHVGQSTVPPPSAGGASAFTAHVIASQDNDTIPTPPPAVAKTDQPTPKTPEEEISLRHPPPSEPLAQRTKQQLSGDELKIVQQLSALDRKVRAHEQAHIAAASGITSSPNYTYVTGPDAQRYVVAGEVKIDNSSEPGSPEATIAKLELVKKAALAPAQPSAQDKSVATAADATIRDAEAEIRARERDEKEQAAIEDAARKKAEEDNEPAVPAVIKQANLAFTQSAATNIAAPISSEALFA